MDEEAFREVLLDVVEACGRPPELESGPAPLQPETPSTALQLRDRTDSNCYERIAAETAADRESAGLPVELEQPTRSRVK